MGVVRTLRWLVWPVWCQWWRGRGSGSPAAALRWLAPSFRWLWARGLG